MDQFYTAERNVQILVALMKANGVRRVIASPGTTNVCLVATLQRDPYFQLYSSVDERSAAYIACGMATETGEPVALSCTGATASRNYIPGLTEAFYRKLPVLAITSTQHPGRVGQHIAQVIDRSQQLNDMVNLSVQVPMIRTAEDEWAATVQLNRAMLALRHRGGGPVHINLGTDYTRDFSVSELPQARVIRRCRAAEQGPELPKGRIAVFVGAHRRWSEELTRAVDGFCAAHGAVVLCDQTSNYRGAYRVLASLADCQRRRRTGNMKLDLLIHIGEVSGAYMAPEAGEVWRVSPDGEVRDTFRSLTWVFETEEEDFFRAYAARPGDGAENGCLEDWRELDAHLRENIPELPFSNIWIAQQSAGRIPEGAHLYLGILNTLRAWNLFETPQSVTCTSNTGGFGIDGGASTLLGISLAAPDKLCYGVIGDLGFFYDMNALGNRHVGSNLRLMLINNGCGAEFKNFNHFAAQFGREADAYIAAAGHYGDRSRQLVRHYAQDLGFEYLCAEDKESYLAAAGRFLTPERTERPMLLEVFVDSASESDALRAVTLLEPAEEPKGAKAVAKRVLGESGVRTLKKIMGR